jgi:predicted transcriptional regulator
LTELEIEELALKLNVSPSIVRDKHEQVWESIEAQDKYGKKVKNIKQTVRNWVKWAIDNNRVEQLSPEARLALIYTSPTRDIALYEKLAKVLKEQEEDGK